MVRRASSHSAKRKKETFTMKNTNKLAKRAWLAAAAALAGSAFVNAQTNQAQTGQPESSLNPKQPLVTADAGTIRPASQVMSINKASSFIGAEVKNQQGVGLGKIRDVVIDLKSARVAYAVLDSGAGTLNPQKLHAVPLGAFEADTDGKTLILNVDRQKLVQSPGFDKSNWPGLTTAVWGAEPFWKDVWGRTHSLEGTDAEQRRLQEQKDKQYQDLEDAVKRTP
jgi:sporulation protein YlmC with PRC-barrel domain